jgi:hypothetical protein
MRTSFHHQPEAQHPKSPAIETPAGRLPHLSADIVAKVANRGAIIFPPEDKTGRDRRLIWPQAYYRSRR